MRNSRPSADVQGQGQEVCLWQYQKLLSFSKQLLGFPEPSGPWGAGWGGQRQQLPTLTCAGQQASPQGDPGAPEYCPTARGTEAAGVSRALTMPVTNGWPRGHGPQAAGRRMPTSFSGCTRWENRSSPCCRLCMFLSDHLRFLKREHKVIGSSPSPPATPALGRILTWPPFALGLEYGGRIDRLFLEFLNGREWGGSQEVSQV